MSSKTVKSTANLTLNRAFGGVDPTAGDASAVTAFKILAAPAAGFYLPIFAAYQQSSTHGAVILYIYPPDDPDFPDSAVLEYHTYPTGALARVDLGTTSTIVNHWVHIAWTRSNTTGAGNLYAILEGFNPLSPSYLATPSLGATVLNLFNVPDHWGVFDDGEGEDSTDLIMGRTLFVNVELTEAQVLAQFGQKAPIATVSGATFSFLALDDSTVPAVDQGNTASNFTAAGSATDYAGQPSEWGGAAPPPNTGLFLGNVSLLG